MNKKKNDSDAALNLGHIDKFLEEEGVALPEGETSTAATVPDRPEPAAQEAGPLQRPLARGAVQADAARPPGARAGHRLRESASAADGVPEGREGRGRKGGRKEGGRKKKIESVRKREKRESRNGKSEGKRGKGRRRRR